MQFNLTRLHPTNMRFLLCVILVLMRCQLRSVWGQQQCQLTETDQLGPYHLANAPLRDILCEDDPKFEQEQLVVTGYVIGFNCKGVVGAEVDIWQANSDGEYDPKVYEDYQVLSWNYRSPRGRGDYRCRGKVTTDHKGAFTFTTVMPGIYNPRPKHLHYRVTSQSRSSVHQMYFKRDNSGGKITSLTIATDPDPVDQTRWAVFNFTIDAQGTYDLTTTTSGTTPTLTPEMSTPTPSPGDTSQTTEEEVTGQTTTTPKYTGENETTCYSCEVCPEPFDPNHSSVSIEHCPPHGCRTWRNLNSRVWSRGCLFSPDCVPPDAAYTAQCCNTNNCNGRTPGSSRAPGFGSATRGLRVLITVILALRGLLLGIAL